jgi:hypothetical protein
MDESSKNLEAALEGVDKEKRATLRRLVVEGAFVTPIVASFAMAGLTIDKASAQPANGSGKPL